jgi:hypothetical protein
MRMRKKESKETSLGRRCLRLSVGAAVWLGKIELAPLSLASTLVVALLPMGVTSDMVNVTLTTC